MVSEAQQLPLINVIISCRPKISISLFCFLKQKLILTTNPGLHSGLLKMCMCVCLCGMLVAIQKGPKLISLYSLAVHDQGAMVL